MDQPYIDALVNQALGAYKADGPDGLKIWIDALPLPHQEEFRQYCKKPLEKAMFDHLAQSIGELLAEFQPVEGQAEREVKTQPDPRKKHTRDRRRTKPL